MSDHLQQAKQLIQECQETQNPYLDLGNCGITDLNDLPELFECTHVETLILSSMWKSEIGKLEYKESINQGTRNSFKSIPEGVTLLKKLHTLVASGGGLREIKALSLCRSLQHLYLDSSKITDISYIKDLNNLEYLGLSFNYIEDFSCLEGLGNLQVLDISSNKITNINFLSSLTSLHSLDLSHNRVSNISPLSILVSLQSLNLSFNSIVDTSSLANLKGLKGLNLNSNQITDIGSFSSLTNLNSLNLGSNSISDISSLSNLINLNSLNLSSNPIKEYNLLSCLKKLHSLELGACKIFHIDFLSLLKDVKKLNLSSNRIKDISSLSSLKNLRSLNLSNNRINDISSLSFLKNLRSINLSSNKISDISSLSDLEELRSLYLSSNPIIDYESLSNQTKLQSLYLRSNEIEDHNFLLNLTGLKRLYLRSSKFKDYNFLSSLKGLQTLDIHSNQIKDYSILSELTNLQSLDLGHNHIVDISFLSNLPGLLSLYINSNEIKDISPLSVLTGLQSLNLSGNNIKDISVLSGLTHLRGLNLNSNEIRDISSLSSLTGLQSLTLSYNQISDINPLIYLMGLQNLNLYSNQVKSIPLFIFDLFMEYSLNNLGGNGLKLDDSLLSSPPLEILEQGRQSVLEWYAANKKNLNEIKIILIGDPKAGKTSLLRRLKDNTFDEKEVQTDGINIESIEFGACETFEQQSSISHLTGHFWDFGGQEIMNSTHQFFLTKRSIYVLVLDARKDKHVATQVRQWVKKISATGGNSSIVIVANQIDVNPGFGFENEYELQKEFPQIKYFVRASCKTRESIDQIKQILEELIPEAELFGAEIDEKWINIKEQLQEETSAKHFIDEGRFISICRTHKLTNNRAQKNAIRFLNDLGLLLHFDNLSLSEYYVLDPYWITYGVYQIITSQYAGKQNGKVAIDKLEYIVNEEEDKEAAYQPPKYQRIHYSPNQRKFLLDILNEFKLCFYTPDQQHFILPNLLGTNEPKEQTKAFREAENKVQLLYEYEYLPDSIMPYIIVEVHNIYKAIWRTGCIIEHQDCAALISKYEFTITITVIGKDKSKREFMSVIRFMMDKINQKSNIKPKMMIPLPNEGGFVDYEVLRAMEAVGKEFYEVYTPKFLQYQISELLEGIVKYPKESTSNFENKLDLILQRLKEGDQTILDNQVHLAKMIDPKQLE